LGLTLKNDDADLQERKVMSDPTSSSAGKYRVLVDDNFHYQEEDKRYEQGVYETLEEAVAICKNIVDEFLAAKHLPGMTAEELYAAYTGFGEDPFIRIEGSGSNPFSAWAYAKGRCAEICAGG
jgi:hypothetical protein